MEERHAQALDQVGVSSMAGRSLTIRTTYTTGYYFAFLVDSY
jgi:hypothetical protein